MLKNENAKITYVTELTDRAFIRLQGSDSATFLQNLLTQDIQRQPNTIAAAALLTPQGKLLDDFLVWQDDDGITLDCDGARVDDIFRKLSMYKLRSDVTLDRQTGHPWAIWSYDADVSDVSDVSDEMTAFKANNTSVYSDPRSERLGLRAYFHPNSNDAWEVAPLKQWNNFRLSLVIPQGAIEMPPGEIFPLEFGLQNANMISFQKGCYIGQEVTSRSYRRGTLKKGLFTGMQAEPAFLANDEITVDGKTVGKIAIAGEETAIALIRLDADMTMLDVSGRRFGVAQPDISK
jgi:tRNA-modifying protein YgfZ